MDVVAAFVTDGEAPELSQPGQCAFDHPPVPAQPLAGIHALAGDAHPDAPPVQEATAAGDVVGLIGMQLLRPFAGTTPRASDGRNGVDEVLEDGAVMPVGPGQPEGERRAPSVGNDMALRARFAAVRRVRSGGRPPFLAGMLALSRQARSQSIWSASPNSSSRARCSRSHTPAVCQSRSRRQQVMPDPQPSSWGSISHGMPDVSTKMMPVKAARSGTRGRPPLGFGGSCGSSDSIRFQSSSGTSGVLIRHCAARPVPRF